MLISADKQNIRLGLYRVNINFTRVIDYRAAYVYGIGNGCMPHIVYSLGCTETILIIHSVSKG